MRYRIKKNLCLFILLFINTSIFSQPSWYKEYGDKINSLQSRDLIHLKNNHYLISGVSYLPYKGFGYLLEIDSIGNLVKENYLNDSINNYIILQNSIQVNNKIYTVGLTNPNFSFNDNNEIYIHATDSVGTNFWTIKVGDSLQDHWATKIQYKNNLLHVISNKNTEERYNKVNIMTIDTFGNVNLNKDIIDTTYKYNAIYDFKVLPDSNYFILGYRSFLNTFYPNKYVFWLLKLNKNGDILFSKTLGNTYINGYTDLENTYDSNIVTVGSEYINSTFSNITKLNYQSNILFSKSYRIDSITNETLTCIQELKDHNFIAGGSYGNIMQIRKFDSLGNSLWVKKIGEKISGTFDKIIQTNDNGYLVTANNSLLINGISVSYVIVIKLDSLGNYNFATTINPVNKTTESISIYPNPTNAIINIQALHPEEIKTIQLYNINGSLINSYPSTSKTIDISDYANGNYYLKIQYQNSFETKKIIKL